LTRLHLYTIATVLILVGLVLIVTGFQQDNFLWQIGLTAIALAMLLSLAGRWIKPKR
jgi:predicted lysophospholipase L1 biosynthesis ABC-type transport system permease subunit